MQIGCLKIFYIHGERKDVTYSGESTRQGFIGKEHDKELGLAEHGVRKYDDELGRFTNPDALWEKYPGWSPYQYSMNNPIMFQDGNGYQEISAENYVRYTTMSLDINQKIDQSFRMNFGKYAPYALSFVGGVGSIGLAMKGIAAGKSILLNTWFLKSAIYSTVTTSASAISEVLGNNEVAKKLPKNFISALTTYPIDMIFFEGDYFTQALTDLGYTTFSLRSTLTDDDATVTLQLILSGEAALMTKDIVIEFVLPFIVDGDDDEEENDENETQGEQDSPLTPQAPKENDY